MTVEKSYETLRESDMIASSSGGSVYSGAGDCFARAVYTLASPHGAISIFGVANSGKTYLAETFVSALMDIKPDPCIANASVISDALKTWVSPVFLSSAVQEGLLSHEAASSFATQVIRDMGFEKYSAIVSHSTMFDFEGYLTFKSLVKAYSEGAIVNKTDTITTESGSVTASNAVPVYSAVLENGDECFVTHLLSPSGGATGASVVLSKSDGDCKVHVVKRQTVHTMVKDMERATGEEVVAFIFDNDFISKVDTDPRTNSWFCASFLNNIIHVGTDVSVNIDGALNLCLTNKGFQWRVPDWILAYPNHKVTSPAGWMSDLVSSRFLDVDAIEEDNSEVAVSRSDPTLEELVASLFIIAPVVLLNFLSQSGLVDSVLKIRRSALFAINDAIRGLVEELEVDEGPILVMTEIKKKDEYTGTACNASVDEKGLLLNLTCKGGQTLEFYAPGASLLNAVIGGLAIQPIVHVSTLDATIKSDRIFASTTQKGGLDSSVLLDMQYIANMASMARGHVVLETRDDFVGDASDETAMERSRATLGSSASVAVQISGTDNKPRKFWVRMKGYGLYDDCILRISGVRKEDYPDNKFRPIGETPTVFDYVAGLTRK